MPAQDSPNPSSMVPGKAPMMARATTLAQLAQFVGVSQSAVSVVLNNSRSKVRVSQATRQRILDAARELNYQPNALTRSVQKGRTNIIGFYNDRGQLFNPMFPFYGSLLKGLMEGCEDHEKNFLVHGAFCKRSEADIFQELINGQIDGLVLYARETPPLVERLVESRLPVVTVADEVPDLPCVTIDDEQAGCILARHLFHRGYRKALFCVTEPVIPPSIQRRLRGFETEAESCGLSVELFLLESIYAPKQDVQTDLKRALDTGSQVLVAYNDFMADYLVTICREAGVSVPSDIAVAGFDGFPSTTRPASYLTTVRAPWDQVARQAVALLVDQCNGKPVPRFTTLPVELIIGDSA